MADSYYMVTSNGAHVGNGSATRNRDAEFLEGLVGNALLFRSEWLKSFMDPRRDYFKECGWPDKNAAIAASDYKLLYDREPFATRVVELFPKESWQVHPLVYEDEDLDNVTKFEEAWDKLGEGLVEGESWYGEERGSSVFEYLVRVDIRSGIGSFGIILLGVDDGLPLNMPIQSVVDAHLSDSQRERMKKTKESTSTSSDQGNESKNGKPRPSSEPSQNAAPSAYERRDVPRESGQKVNPVEPSGPMTDSSGYPLPPEGTDAQYWDVPYGDGGNSVDGDGEEDKPTKSPKLIYLRVFDESLVQITRYESDEHSPRFCKPVMYRVTMNDPRESHTGIGLPMVTKDVHWTRVIHVADNLGNNETHGVPRLRPVYNCCQDSLKIRGAAGEGYWRMAFPGISLETHPQLGGDVDIDRTQSRRMLEDFQNSLQRFLILSGMSAKTIAGTAQDPTPFLEANIAAICVYLGCPVRVFKGSERGELASTQDDGAWNDRLKHRQVTYLTPRVICPFIDRLIQVGVLPKPTEGRGLGEAGAEQLGPDGKPIPNPEGTDEEIDATEGQGEPKPSPFAPKNGKPSPPAPGQPAPPGKPLPPGVHNVYRRTTRTIWVYNAEAPNPPDEEGNPVPPGKMEEKQVPFVEKSTVVKTKAGYTIEWPDLSSTTENERADILTKQTTALQTYIAGGVEAMVPQKAFLTEFVKMDEEKVQAMLDEAEASQQALLDKQAASAGQQMDQQQEAIDRGLVPDPTDPEQVKAHNPQPIVAGGAVHPPGPPGAPPGKGLPPQPGGPPKPGQPPGAPPFGAKIGAASVRKPAPFPPK